MRATIFATWLIETYGRDKLAADGGVLDVAGGKGKLSIQLALQGKIQSTIIDGCPFSERTVCVLVLLKDRMYLVTSKTWGTYKL